MNYQLESNTPTHLAASQLEEAISLLEIHASSVSGPTVEKLEQSLRSIHNQRKHLECALKEGDLALSLKEMERLVKKVARALRNYKSLFMV